MANHQKPSTTNRTSSRPGSRTSLPRSRPNTGSRRQDSAGSGTRRIPSGYGTRKPSITITRQSSNPTHISTVGFYEKVKQVLTKPSKERRIHELQNLESWFKKKSKLFGKLKKDVLLDVMKHCEFQTVPADCVIIQQGYTMKHFYIIVRGSVSTMVKEESADDKEYDLDDDRRGGGKDSEDSDDEESIPPMETDRTKLGSVINTKGDGDTFGELSLYSGEHDRTASIVSDEVTDLVVISKELYERSVAKIVGQEYEHNQRFVNNNKLFREWSIKQRRHLSLIIHRQKFAYDEMITKQGDSANYLYFIHSGEVKLVIDPDLHTEHFPEFIRKTGSCIADESFKPNLHFGLHNYWSQKSRQARMVNHATEAAMMDGKIQSKDLQENKLILSPSAVRKKMAVTKSQMHRKYNVCYLEAGQLLGDVELLVGLEKYHATAVSTSQETIIFKLHKIQFNRYFVKRNQETVSMMTKSLGMQMPRRIEREQIKKYVPLLQCIMVSLDETNGTNFIKKKPKLDDADMEILGLTEQENASPARWRTKSGISSKSFPLSGKQREENELLRHSSLGFGLPESSQQAMLKYLNNQVNLTLNTDAVSEAVTDNVVSERTDEGGEDGEDGEAADAKAGTQQAGADGVYAMAKNKEPVKEKKRERPINPRHGIFFKVIQVSNPNIDKNLLAIEEEEFNYLCQVKRRIAKQLHNFYPFASLESFLHLGDDQPKTGRLCRRAMATAGADQATMLKRKELANLPKKTALKSSGARRVSQSADGGGRKNVGFALPK